jgi:uncharacterized membrane protein
MSTKRRKPTALRAAARVAASSEPPKAASVASTRLDAIDAPKSTNARVDCVDAARGFAIAMMFAYHFCFDLSFFRVIHQDFYNDARWIAWRSVILSSFLLLAGIGLALAHAAANAAANPGSAANAAANPHSARWSWPRYWRRLAQIAACAALVSIGSYWVFPESWIYFGVLHHIALASVLALPLLRASRLCNTRSLTHPHGIGSAS